MIGPIIYRDDDNLYLEWPSHALRFPFTEGGLGKALKLVPYFPSPRAAPRGTSNFPPTPERILKPRVAKGTKHGREVRKFSTEQRSKMMELIRKRESQ